MYAANQEGFTHINAYSKSRTRLGRLLSNFASTPFVCNDGQFDSVEGYWYWLSCTDPRKEELRHTSGFVAKKLGRELRATDWPELPDFQTKIKEAVWYKIFQTPELKELLRNSELPIVHYYSYGTPPKITIPNDGLWIWEYVEFVRQYLKEHPEL